MTILPLILVPILFFAGAIRLIGSRNWGWPARIGISSLVIVGPPVFLWAFALSAPGSGWFFGLIALIVTATSLFGALMGWIWLSLSR